MYRLRRRVGLGARRPPLLRTDVTRATTVHRAVRPNQVWSWDITYLPTVTRGRFLRLYLVMDVWSRRIVGWEVHDDESAERAATLIQRICADSGVDPNGLVLHSDNGKPMRGNTMIATLQWLGIVPSFSRPARLQRQPVFGGAVSNAQAHASLSASAVRKQRRGTSVGRSVCQLVQHRASSQRDSICHARPTTRGRRCRHPGASPRALRTRPAADAATLVRQDSKLGTRRRRGTQSGAHGGGTQCGILMGATTTLTLTAGMNCYPCLRSAPGARPFETSAREGCSRAQIS